MGELVFLKLGGSLITDEYRYETPRPAAIARAAREIMAALQARPDLQLVLGHGSGSFGHFIADKYHLREGNLQDWRGYAEVAAGAQRLNRLVTDTMLAEGLRAVSLQPSASARCHNGELVEMAVEPLAEMLRRGLMPIVYDDVAIDDQRGCTFISCEEILAHLARRLYPARVIIADEAAGIYSGDPQRDAVVRLIPEINARNYEQIERTLATSFGTEVDGGTLRQVRLWFQLVQEQPKLVVQVLTGRRSRLIERALINPAFREGTLIRHEASG